MTHEEITERFDEIAFAAMFVPQVIHVRNVVTYPWFACGLKAVVLGGKTYAGEKFLSVTFAQFTEYNLAAMIGSGARASIENQTTVNHTKNSMFTDRYSMPYFNHRTKQHTVDLRYEVIPYREGMA